ncbi:hypothetical protein [Bacillus sp. FJAT-49736]|uniref:hypothetical protein n=1 Tax=Bacillus sp. FJAT-49736 TaxID=2833582 RepID=UPI001BC96BAD|nr:hypothetical protein [Bacillus sp. FJAT-49736]MBS4174581.1 hypothetical protein [Bacillus sp. FJAT-49736]
MEELSIQFQEILSNGHLIRGNYYLVCNGNRLANQMVRIQMPFSFNHAVQCTSLQDTTPKSVFIITPLREWTSIKIQVLLKERYVDFYMYIDLKKKKISLEGIEGSKINLSNSYAARIISCFGIKRDNKVLYFMDLQRIKTRPKRTWGNA